jgi:exosortase/archaeosortase family protein
MIKGFKYCLAPSTLWLLPLGWLWFVLIHTLSPEWTLNPQYGYGWAVPFLCGYLIWRTIRDYRPPTTDIRPSFAGLCHLPSSVFHAFLVLCALLYAPTRLLQEANPGWRLTSWALAMEVVGITLCVLRMMMDAGKQQSEACPPFSVLRVPFFTFIFPVCFFLVAVPWPTGLEQGLIQGMTRLDASGAVGVIGWFGIPAIPHGNVIEVATGMVGIDEACSGIRSFQATLMISLFLGEFYRLNFFRRAGLMLGGFGLSFLFNLTRMSLLVWVAARRGVPAIAAWHDPAGVTILLGCFFGLWGMAVWLAANQTAEIRKQKSEIGERGAEAGRRRSDV